MGRTQANLQKGKPANWRFFIPQKERDPNAMDVDAMTIDKQTHLMKEGRCFKCKKTGHWANDCPDDETRRRKWMENNFTPTSEVYSRKWLKKRRKCSWRWQKKWVFEKESCLDVNLSFTWYLLCNCSNNRPQYNFYSPSHCYTEENRRHSLAHWLRSRRNVHWLKLRQKTRNKTAS